MADGQRGGAPAGFMDCIAQRDIVSIALKVLHAIDTLEPVEVPRALVPSPKLRELLDGHPCTVPDEQKDEHAAYVAARDARAQAKQENVRRLRATLWAEQCLRANRKQEHEVLRAFNRDVWGVHESASRDMAEREAQVRAHA